MKPINSYLCRKNNTYTRI